MELSYLLSPSFQASDINGKPLTGGYIEVYVHGTSHTKYITFSDFVGNRNPFWIPLNDKGMASIICDASGEYDVYCYNANGVQQWSRERVRCVSVQSIVYEGDKVTVSGVQGHTKVTSSTVGDQTNYEVDIDDAFVEQVDDNTQAISEISEALLYKKDKQTPYESECSATKTIKNVTQNDNGEINVEYQDIDLPQESPNVEITSPNDTLSISESTDPQTNTKTFTIDVKNTEIDYYSSGIDGWYKIDVGSLPNFMTLDNPNDLQKYGSHGITLADNNTKAVLNSGKKYIASARIRFNVNNPSNEAATLQFQLHCKDGTTGSYPKFNVDFSYKHTDSVTFSWLVEDSTSTYIKPSWFGASQPSSTDWSIGVEEFFICEQSAFSGGGSGTTYTEGEAIKIENDEISVNYGSGLEVDENNKLKVKIGNGLKFNEESLEVEIDNDVSDVVETVEKLEQDLDSQLTVNFDMANITDTYDFADGSVTTLTNGATMLCQAFTVPINHEIRTASEDQDPTLLGIYAKQAYNTKIMLALYVYDFDTGYTDYVGDTGPVTVKAGRNEFPLVHINPNISELKSSCVYYAALYLPSSHNNGLYLASCANYATASYINATPRFSVGVQNITYNGSEIDMTDATTGRLDYNDGNGNYYIGPWSDGYNERPYAPRFFMQLRNGTVEQPVIVDPFDNISSYTVNQVLMGNLFSDASDLGSGIYPVVFRDVTPSENVTIDWWESFSGDATESNAFGGLVFDSGFSAVVNGTSGTTVTEMGSADGVYGHKYTPASPITLLANTTYRFAVLVGPNDSYNATGLQYSTPTTTCNLHLFQSGWSINEWASYKRLNGVQAMPLVLHDTDGNTWRI